MLFFKNQLVVTTEAQKQTQRRNKKHRCKDIDNNYKNIYRHRQWTEWRRQIDFIKHTVTGRQRYEHIELDITSDHRWK